jgi:Fe-S-cluster containining protein
MNLKRKLPVVPPMRCDTGCGDCCGPVPVTDAELSAVKRHMARYRVKPKNNGEWTCPFYDGKCTIYEARPNLCKLFGHTANLRCHRGYNTNALPDVEVRAFLVSQGPATTTLHSLIPKR